MKSIPVILGLFACLLALSPLRADSSPYVEVGQSGRSADAIENRKIYSLFPAWTNAFYRCVTLDNRLTANDTEIRRVQELIFLKKETKESVSTEDRILKDLYDQKKIMENVRPKEHAKRLELEREIDAWKSKLAPGVATKLTTASTETNKPSVTVKISSQLQFQTHQIPQPLTIPTNNSINSRIRREGSGVK